MLKKVGKVMEQNKRSFLNSVIAKEEEFITKLLEEKISIQKKTEEQLKELKVKYDKLWQIEKENIDKQSYSVEKKESGIRENILWQNFYELIKLGKDLDKDKDKAVMILVDFFLRGGKLSD